MAFHRPSSKSNVQRVAVRVGAYASSYRNPRTTCGAGIRAGGVPALCERHRRAAGFVCGAAHPGRGRGDENNGRAVLRRWIEPCCAHTPRGSPSFCVEGQSDRSNAGTSRRAGAIFLGSCRPAGAVGAKSDLKVRPPASVKMQKQIPRRPLRRTPRNDSKHERLKKPRAGKKRRALGYKGRALGYRHRRENRTLETDTSQHTV